MSTKDYFNKDQSIIRVAASASMGDLGNEVESAEFIQEKIKDTDRFVPFVDFSKPENFVRFGSAEEYYAESIKRVYRTYPYDGSLKEKTQWHNSSSFLDRYIFDKVYPRSTGYAIFSSNGWGSVSATKGAMATENEYGLSATPEYILIKGGPHKDPSYSSMSKLFPSADGKSNIYDYDKNRESNLKFGGNDGNTVEFWLWKHDFDPSKTKKEVIFDATTTDYVSSSTFYGRLRIELSATTRQDESPFYVTYLSGNAGDVDSRSTAAYNGGGFYSASIGDNLTTASIADRSWHHYAFTFSTSGSGTGPGGTRVRLYVDGDLNTETIVGTSASYVSGNINAAIGALITEQSGAENIDWSDATGYGKMSASVDEFRFWKVERTPKEIGRNWFTQVYGGTNTDDANTQLGVYYKFNEGVSATSSYDSKVLDYSGRISSGSWEGYLSTSRNTGSAILSASAAVYEFEDPILYSFHTNVTSALDSYSKLGKNFDYQNNASIYNSIPEWIISEDRYVGSNLLKLTQIMSSYFDTLAYQIKALPSIKNISYTPFTSSFISTGSGPTGSGEYKPLPFANRLLESAGLTTPEIFLDADVISKFTSRDEKILFKDNLYDTKNLIYQNIYNNLIYIYKSKGTEKAFRNAIRCFGIDDELIKINVYANNITYELKDSYNYTVQKKNFVDFHIPDHNTAVIYQATSSNSNTVSFISGSEEFYSGSARTLEAEIIFPRRETYEKPGQYIIAPGLTSSLFGTKGAYSINTELQSDLNDHRYTTWQQQDHGDLRVMAVKDTHDILSTNAYFKLTSSTMAINLTSAVFYDVYEGEKWNFAVRIRPSTYPMANKVSGSRDAYAHGSGTVEFCGVNASNNAIRNEFYLTASSPFPGSDIGASRVNHWIGSPKRVYAGALRANFTGTLQVYSDVKVSSVRYWFDYLPDEAIKAHAKDSGNAGVVHPYDYAYLFNAPTASLCYIPKIETLALNWDFDRVTGSDSTGGFVVEDISSGSAALTGKYGPLGNILNAQHTGVGYGFKASSAKVVDKNYLPVARQRLPESVASSDMIEIRNRDDINFTRETRPITHFIAVEKSMYQTISEEMMKMFATIKDFNSLIGEPVNRYRQSYKRMEKLRQLFFERVENVSDLDRYIEFYKWLDSSIDKIIEQFFPISSDASDSIRNMVESHVLERNKYWTKFPTLEMKHDPPTGQILAINELLYPWKQGHAPLPDNAATAVDCIDTTDYIASSADASFTIAIPTSANGLGGTAVTFLLDQDKDDVSQATAAANTITIGTKDGTDALVASFLINAINGVTAGRFIYASEGNGQAGHDLGITAEQGSSDTQITLTMDTIGNVGNIINALASASGVNIIDVTGFTGGTLLPENCLWWKDRLGRDGTTPLGSQDGATDRSKEAIRRIATTIVSSSGPTYQSNPYVYRKLTRPYKFSTDVSVELHGGINFAPSKRLDFYKNLLTFGRNNHIQIDLNDFENPACTDLLDLKKKSRQPFKVTFSTDAQSKGEIYAPFSIFSSSEGASDVTAGITSIHTDAYGYCKEVPMQGPFTEQYVGGMPHRHAAIFTSAKNGPKSIAFNGVDNQSQLDVPHADNLSFGDASEDSPLSFAAWVKVDSDWPEIFRIVAKTKSSASTVEYYWSILNDRSNSDFDYRMIAVLVDENTSNAYIGQKSNATDAMKAYEDTWIHVCVTYAATEASSGIIMYVNGEVHATAAYEAGSYTAMHNYGAGSDLAIGRGQSYNGIDVAKGAIDELVIFNKALSPAEITTLYNNGGTWMLTDSWSAQSNIVSWWRMGDGQSITFDNAGVRNDATFAVKNFTILDQVSSNDATMSSFQGTATSGITPYAVDRQSLVSNRPEAWSVVLPAYSNGKPTQIRLVEVDSDEPRSWVAREGYAKRPVNIKNIQQLTGNEITERTIIGNYTKNYQVVQTSGRYTNPRYFAETKGAISESVASTTVSGVYDFALPDRGRHASVFVEKFSSPGGPEVMSRGFLDIVAEEFSVYNSLNNRNLSVRQPLQTLLTRHANSGGYASFTPDYLLTHPPSASYHKTYRNRRGKIMFSSSAGTSETNILPVGGNVFANAPGSFHAVTGSSFDNWYVMRTIPRSDVQYAWIAHSVHHVTGVAAEPANLYAREYKAVGGSTRSDFTILGYQKPAYMRSGSEEHDAYNAWNASTDIVFVSSSDFVSFFATGYATPQRAFGMSVLSNYHASAGQYGFIHTDFVGMNTIIQEPISSSFNTLGHDLNIGVTHTTAADERLYLNYGSAARLPDHPGGIITATNTNSTTGTPGIKKGIWADAALLNSLLLNRNGPYHYPSWKQVRTGEHPVARHQRRNNILDFTIGPIASLRIPTTVKQLSADLKHAGRYTELRYGREIFTADIIKELDAKGVKFPVRKETITPVTSKYKPLEHTIVDSDTEIKVVGVHNIFTLRNTLGNNMNYFPIGQGVLDQQLGITPDFNNVVYDEITNELNSPVTLMLEGERKSYDLVNLSYREIIFPKEENTYLAKIRGRQHYSESAGLTHEGYDRRDYRTFWRNRAEDRLRTDSVALNSMGIPIKESMWNGDTTGYAVKLRQFDRLVDTNDGVADFSDGLEMIPTCLSVWPLDSTSASGSVCGELFSNPYMSMTASYITASATLYDTAGPEVMVVPTASQTYLFQNLYHALSPNSHYITNVPPKYVSVCGDDVVGGRGFSGSHFKPQWSSSFLSGKSPFYDSYEDWALDVRTMGQGYSIVPEFKISDHMDYYIDNGYEETNKKFLSLIGALHTASSDTPTSTGNQTFYKLYSHSDFMKFSQLINSDYLGTSLYDYDAKGRTKDFTLRCKAIKKLLPYNGFYPVNRCIQLGTMFSQSYGPYLTASTFVHPYEQLQSVLQPFFAPGIMYNTIKSGVAVDWAAYTGSAPSAGGHNSLSALSQTASAGAMSVTPVAVDGGSTDNYHNFRYPFESLIEPHAYMPSENQGKRPEQYMMLPAGTPQQGGSNTIGVDDGAANKHAIWTGEYEQNYSMAMHNFLGEIPRFFLDDGKFQSFKSRPGTFHLISGTTYFMDVLMYKSGYNYSKSGSAVDDPARQERSQNDMIMFEGPDYPFESNDASVWYADMYRQNMQSGSARGIHYGPACQTSNNWWGHENVGSSDVHSGTIAHHMQDPAFAPYTPPYFYGKSVARLAFSPHKSKLLLSAVDLNASYGEVGEFTVEEILKGAQLETQYDPDPEETWNRLSDYGSGSYKIWTIDNDNQNGATDGSGGSDSLALKSKMTIGSSLNLFGKTIVPEITYNPITGQAVEAKASLSDESLQSWVISPKFETPILNFSGNIDANLGYSTRGMWYGYGVEPTGSQGIYMGLRESHPTTILKAMLGGAGENALHGIGTQPADETRLGHRQTGSLYQVLGFPQSTSLVGPTRKLGQIAQNKTISEAVIAVPIKANFDQGKSPFFPISRDKIHAAKLRIEEGKGAEDIFLERKGVAAPSQTVYDMVTKLRKYYLPPHMDFVANPTIEPFAAIVFEFHHCLQKQDLIDIWQNLMPKIAMEAEKDESVVTITAAGARDFLDIENLPKDTRWMVFKVKQKAEKSYYSVTEDVRDDHRFRFDIGEDKYKNPKYNYNWPYDFFSLIELVQLESELQIYGRGQAAVDAAEEEGPPEGFF